MNKKLQAEIDRTLKKVNEGLELFDSLHEKLESSPLAQREKLETELKKELKKLQRLREQVRTWIQSNEKIDKTILGEYRRKIEQVF